MKINPQEKINALLEKIDEKNRYYIFIGLLLFLFLLDYLLLMRPQLSALTKIGPEIKLLSEDLKKAKDDIKRVDFYKQEVARFHEKVDDIQGRVKYREEIPLVLERISRIAMENNVKIDQIIPQSGTQKPILDAKDKKYFRLPISVDARGKYHDLGRFLNALERDRLAMFPLSLTISSGGEGKLHAAKLSVAAVVIEKK
jgi:Tfp pilus assembly protein PilO